MRRIAATSIIIVLVSGCADQKSLYDGAIRDTAVYTAAHVQPLTPLAYPVQAANLTAYSDWAAGQIGKTVPLARDTWITVEPELRQACRTFPPTAVVARLHQLLGLKPATPQDAPKVVLMTIAQAQPVGPTGKGIFRPCADPDPTTATCGNTLKGPDTYGAWLAATALGNYRVDAEIKDTGYPWTRLGYTWNWDPASPDHRGLQEYVVPQGTQVTIRGVVPAATYCATGE
jgi:hypothetical protein